MLDRQTNQICEGVNISYIKSQKFKVARVSFTVFVPLNKETASLNAVLLAVLERSCKKYPDFSSFNKKLEELYGANIYSSVDKVGDSQALTISAVCINDDSAFDKSKVTLNVAELLSEMIFNPCLDGEKFREEDVIQAKRQIKEMIQSEQNDKKSYAKLRCTELMCQDEKFGINKYGKKEDIDKITSENLFQAWKNLLETGKTEILILGNHDYNAAYKLFLEKFSKIQRKNIQKCETFIKDRVENVREFEDFLDVSQCKLVIGFRVPIKTEEYIFSTGLMSALLGGTPTSKLFLNVRETLSLCYYCSSNFNKDKGIMFIESGIEQKNFIRAKQEILKQLEEIKKGNFSEEELDETKIYLSQSFKKIEDSLSAVGGWYICQSLSKKVFTPKEYANRINNVTKSQIIEAAKNIQLDTIYLLMGKGGKISET